MSRRRPDQRFVLFRVPPAPGLPAIVVRVGLHPGTGWEGPVCAPRFYTGRRALSRAPQAKIPLLVRDAPQCDIAVRPQAHQLPTCGSSRLCSTTPGRTPVVLSQRFLPGRAGSQAPRHHQEILTPAGGAWLRRRSFFPATRANPTGRIIHLCFVSPDWPIPTSTGAAPQPQQPLLPAGDPWSLSAQPTRAGTAQAPPAHQCSGGASTPARDPRAPARRRRRARTKRT